MKLKGVAISLVAGAFLLSPVYAEQNSQSGNTQSQTGADQGSSRQQDTVNGSQRSGSQGTQQGDLGAGSQSGSMQGSDQQSSGLESSQQGGGAQSPQDRSMLGGGMQGSTQGNMQGSEQGSGMQSGSMSMQKGSGMQSGKMNSSVIQQAQQKLNDQGFNAGPVDGKFGPATKQAVKKFQQAKGISPSGQIDTQTLAALGVQGQDSGAGGTQQGQAGTQSDTQQGMQGSSQPGGGMQGNTEQQDKQDLGAGPGIGSQDNAQSGSDLGGSGSLGSSQPSGSGSGSDSDQQGVIPQQDSQQGKNQQNFGPGANPESGNQQQVR